MKRSLTRQVLILLVLIVGITVGLWIFDRSPRGKQPQPKSHPNCTYKGQLYSQGAVERIDSGLASCDGGKWVPLKGR